MILGMIMNIMAGYKDLIRKLLNNNSDSAVQKLNLRSNKIDKSSLTLVLLLKIHFVLIT